MPRFKEAAIDKLKRQCRESKRVPDFEEEFLFAKDPFGRRWRADLCWPRNECRLVVEVDGAVYIDGRHTRGSGYEEDCRKQAAATMLGFRYLKVTPRHIETSEAIHWIEATLTHRYDSWTYPAPEKNSETLPSIPSPRKGSSSRTRSSSSSSTRKKRSKARRSQRTKT